MAPVGPHVAVLPLQCVCVHISVRSLGISVHTCASSQAGWSLGTGRAPESCVSLPPLWCFTSMTWACLARFHPLQLEAAILRLFGTWSQASAQPVFCCCSLDSGLSALARPACSTSPLGDVRGCVLGGCTPQAQVTLTNRKASPYAFIPSYRPARTLQGDRSL